MRIARWVASVGGMILFALPCATGLRAGQHPDPNLPGGQGPPLLATEETIVFLAPGTNVGSIASDYGLTPGAPSTVRRPVWRRWRGGGAERRRYRGLAGAGIRGPARGLHDALRPRRRAALPGQRPAANVQLADASILLKLATAFRVPYPTWVMLAGRRSRVAVTVVSPTDPTRFLPTSYFRCDRRGVMARAPRPSRRRLVGSGIV